MVERNRAYDGQCFILSDGKRISVDSVNKITIVLGSFTIFNVLKKNDEGRDYTLMKVIYPGTNKDNLDKERVVMGEERPTRSVHYLEGHCVKRMLDFKFPHKVELKARRDIIIETIDGGTYFVSFDGNCLHKLAEVTEIDFGGTVEEAIEYYDRAADILEIAKKINLWTVSKI